MPWADVKKEMTAEKGLDAAVADKIGEYVGLKGAYLCSKSHSTILSSVAKRFHTSGSHANVQDPPSRSSSASCLTKL